MSISQFIVYWVGHLTFNQQIWLALAVLVLLVIAINTALKGLAFGYLWICSKTLDIPLGDLIEDYNAEYYDGAGRWC